MIGVIMWGIIDNDNADFGVHHGFNMDSLADILWGDRRVIEILKADDTVEFGVVATDEVEPFGWGLGRELVENERFFGGGWLIGATMFALGASVLGLLGLWLLLRDA